MCVFVRELGSETFHWRVEKADAAELRDSGEAQAFPTHDQMLEWTEFRVRIHLL